MITIKREKNGKKPITTYVMLITYVVILLFQKNNIKDMSEYERRKDRKHETSFSV